MKLLIKKVMCSSVLALGLISFAPVNTHAGLVDASVNLAKATGTFTVEVAKKVAIPAVAAYLVGIWLQSNSPALYNYVTTDKAYWPGSYYGSFQNTVSYIPQVLGTAGFGLNKITANCLNAGLNLVNSDLGSPMPGLANFWD